MLLPVSSGNQWEVSGCLSSCSSLSKKSTEDLFFWLFNALAVPTLSLAFRTSPAPCQYYRQNSLNASTFLPQMPKAVTSSAKGKSATEPGCHYEEGLWWKKQLERPHFDLILCNFDSIHVIGTAADLYQFSISEIIRRI